MKSKIVTIKMKAARIVRMVHRSGGCGNGHGDGRGDGVCGY